MTNVLPFPSRFPHTETALDQELHRVQTAYEEEIYPGRLQVWEAIRDRLWGTLGVPDPRADKTAYQWPAFKAPILIQGGGSAPADIQIKGMLARGERGVLNLLNGLHTEGVTPLPGVEEQVAQAVSTATENYLVEATLPGSTIPMQWHSLDKPAPTLSRSDIEQELVVYGCGAFVMEKQRNIAEKQAILGAIIHELLREPFTTQ